MATDWWANQIGVASAASTPQGAIPPYGLAFDVAQAPWPDSNTFNNWAADRVKASRQRQLAEAEGAKEESNLFDRAIGGLFSSVSTIVGSFKDPSFSAGDYMPGSSRAKERIERQTTAGSEAISAGVNADIVGGVSIADVGRAANRYVIDPLETPFIASAQGIRDKNAFWFADGSTWSKAWNLAETKTPGQALVDWVVQGADPSMSNKDLDRMRRTNSLYAMTSFAGDLALGWKADPTVLGAKVIGETRAIAKGTLPRGQSSSTAAAEAIRAARGDDPYSGMSPTRRYGAWRGERIARNFDELRKAAVEMSFTDFSNLSMFRRSAVGGPQAALAFRLAAKDDAMWDLTRRAVLADPKAWGEIKAIKEGGAPEELAKYAGTDVRTFIDAIDATRGTYKKLDDEVADLETLIAKRSAEGPKTDNAGFFEFYNKELHSTLEKRKADLDELDTALQQYDDYGTWLDSVPSLDNPRVGIEQVRARPATLDFLSRKTYQKNLYGKAHSVYEISKAGFLKEANPIDLHRVEVGVQSIRRQFEQFQHYFDYVNPDALEDTLLRFTTAMAKDDKLGAYKIAKEIEDTHLIDAMAGKYGLLPETLTAFLNQTRFRQNEMANALVSGEGAIYSTAPGLLDAPGAKLVERKNGKARIELTEGDHRQTIEIPVEALDSMRPIDPTQTPNWYTPQNTYQLKRAVERNAELFEELDSHMRNFGRKATGTVFEAVDKFGTAWNQFWKPLQLFRLAWPQRVLMDEGLRGMAMLGMSSWMKNYGGAFATASINAINPLEHGPIAAFVKRRQLKIGPGPLADEAVGRKIDVAAHEANVADAPMVPSYFAPRRSKKRAAAMDGMVEEMEEIRRVNMRVSALARAQARAEAASEARYTEGLRLMLEDDFADPIVAARRASRIHVPGVGKHVDTEDYRLRSSVGYALPINVRLREFVNEPFAKDVPSQRVIHDIDGKPVKSGYAVPVFTQELRKAPKEMSRGEAGFETEAPFQHDLNEFLIKHKELLSSGGYRVMFESGRQMGEGFRASIVRVFRGNEIPKAIDFGHHTGADRLINMSKGQQEYIRKWTDKSPIMERLDRMFKVEEEMGLIPGDSPGRWGRKKVPPVYHGSQQGLPDELLPRDQAPLLSGNLYGQGFYTTVDHELASTYDRGAGLYTIRGAKDGKKYKVFDIDATMSEKDVKDLIKFGDEWVAAKAAELRGQDPNPLGLEFQDSSPISFNRQANDQLAQDLELNWRSLRTEAERSQGFRAWRSLFENHAPWSDSPDRVDKILTEFLEQKRGAGAITHVGGVVTGGKRHQVFIWLHPEELIVRPAYDKTGRWYALEDWFDNPDSLDELVDLQQARVDQLREIPEELMSNVEKGQLRMAERAVENTPRTLRNEVPESRIHRVGPKPAAAQREAEAAVRERDAAASGELRAQEREAMDLDGLDDLDFNIEVDNVHDRFIRRLLRRREFGRGYAKWESHDGETITGKAALEAEGEIYLHLMSGAPAYARLTDAYKRTLSQSRSRAVGYKRISPADFSAATLRTTKGREAAKEYLTAWADLLNDQVRNSPIWFRMLEGQTDEQIVNFLRNTAEGARIRRQIPHKAYDTDRWVSEHRQALDFYLPRRDLQALLKERRLNPSDLRRIESGDMPEVFGADLEMIDGGTGVGRWWGRMVEKTYHALGTVPTDVLSRQPFFKGMYDLKMKNMIAATDSDMLTPEVMRAYEKRAREFALRQVKRTMFDLSDDTNMTQALRFMAPFWGAQQEALTKWLNIAIERPETVARFYVGLESVYNNFQVVDEDGRPVKGPRKAGEGIFGYNPNDRVIVQIPKGLKKVAPFDRMLDAFGAVGISFGAANTALQGDNPLLPSLGPIVAVPADKFLNTFWDTHATDFDDNFFYRWLFPVGRPQGGGVGAALEQMFPGWGRRMVAMSEGQDSRSWANTYFSIYREMERDNRKRGLPPPTPEEVDKAAKWHFALRTFASFAAPVAMEFRPKNQFFLDQYHEMNRKFGPSQAFEKFVEKFGADAARYAASSSTGFVPPTSKGMSEWAQNKKLIEKYRDWAPALISGAAYEDDFSSDAYGAQFDIKLGPGTDDRIRELQDTAERVRLTDERLGWLEYRKVQSAINAELFSRGLTSIQQVGAEDLADLKRLKVADLKRQLPGWADAIDTYSNTIYQRIGELREFAYDKRFDNRPEFQGVRQYLMIRDAAAQSLDQYAMATGGSRSLQAEENTQLRQWFYAQVGQLVMDNPSFGEFYSRYLDTDTLERGSG